MCSNSILAFDKHRSERQHPAREGSGSRLVTQNKYTKQIDQAPEKTQIHFGRELKVLLCAWPGLFAYAGRSGRMARYFQKDYMLCGLRH